jgi:hypothetical protein
MEQYYFTFYCDELCVDLKCVLEYDEEEPDVGIKASMTLINAFIENRENLCVAGIMKLELVDEIEAAALKDIHDTERDF